MGIILTLIGLGGFSDDIETWQGWLAPVAKVVAGDPVRWAFLGVGLILLVWRLWDAARRRFIAKGIELQELEPKKLTGMQRHWILRYRVHNRGPTADFGARANFVVNGDSTGSPPWYTGWGVQRETYVQIIKDHYEDLNVAVVVEPGNVSERWRVHGVRPPYESVGFRDDPITNRIGLSFLIAPRSGKGSRDLGIRIQIQDATPRAIEDACIK